MILYRVETTYACGGIVTDNNKVVIEAPPIFAWMIGKSIRQIRKWRKLKKLEAM